ncbi:unnamed protein product [Ambrosiozyma monospora]|uniref:Unnamed protein product n=1 Tax=Ambrosiozyma monospora TaxID=43982 RepID=A0A9W6YSS1_AMBMO|nr:unnamed protein product [Ambrosiozyma monospora]
MHFTTDQLTSSDGPVSGVASEEDGTEFVETGSGYDGLTSSKYARFVVRLINIVTSSSSLLKRANHYQ